MILLCSDTRRGLMCRIEVEIKVVLPDRVLTVPSEGAFSQQMSFSRVDLPEQLEWWGVQGDAR